MRNAKSSTRPTKATSLPRALSDDVLRSVAGGAASELPIETVGLNYGKIEWIYTQQKRPDGAGGGNVTAKYDLVKAKGA